MFEFIITSSVEKVLLEGSVKFFLNHFLKTSFYLQHVVIYTYYEYNAMFPSYRIAIGSVPIFISDGPSVSTGTYFFRHDFCNGEGLERSDSESDTRRIGYLSIRSEKLMETHLEQ